jgi:hypothetical protein
MRAIWVVDEEKEFTEPLAKRFDGCCRYPEDIRVFSSIKGKLRPFVRQLRFPDALIAEQDAAMGNVAPSFEGCGDQC